MDTLAIRHATALPIREISALTVRVTRSGPLELLAVGDEDFAVIAAEIRDDGTPGATWRHDLFMPLVGTGIDLRSGSGFEGVATDGDGTVLVLQEEESRLLVFSADLSKLLQVLVLAVPEDAPGYGADWYKDTNKRGEGLLLLKRGHVLVAKQKKPVYLIEFGPQGDQAGGIGRGTVLPSHARFKRPKGPLDKLVPLAAWELNKHAAKELPTINDIAFGDDSRVYVLSSESHVIGRLEKRLKPGERVSTDESWRIDGDLPGGKDAQPEGLALLEPSTPVVGFDSKSVGDNLVLLNQAE